MRSRGHLNDQDDPDSDHVVHDLMDEDPDSNKASMNAFQLMMKRKRCFVQEKNSLIRKDELFNSIVRLFREREVLIFQQEM